jgi:hypothetical protein
MTSSKRDDSRSSSFSNAVWRTLAAAPQSDVVSLVGTGGSVAGLVGVVDATGGIVDSTSAVTIGSVGATGAAADFASEPAAHPPISIASPSARRFGNVDRLAEG